MVDLRQEETMGGKLFSGWKLALQERLLSSAQYTEVKPFTVERKGKTHTGFLECGTAGGVPVIYLRPEKRGSRSEVAIPIEPHVLIDGVKAPLWEEAAADGVL